MPLPSTRDAALKSMVTHAFMRGVGYMRFEDEMPAGPHDPARCSPPRGAPDRSRHLLKPPGAVPMTFTWIEREAAWARDGGLRMAFSAAYLSSHGWTYARPAPQ